MVNIQFILGFNLLIYSCLNLENIQRSSDLHQIQSERQTQRVSQTD